MASSLRLRLGLTRGCDSIAAAQVASTPRCVRPRPARCVTLRAFGSPPAKPARNDAHVTRNSKGPDFEQALAELEGLVERLERGDLPLDEALKIFERGVALTRHCQSSLQAAQRSEEHTSELQSRSDLVCRLLLEKKKTEPRTDAIKPDIVKRSDIRSTKVQLALQSRRIYSSLELSEHSAYHHNASARTLQRRATS